MCGLVNIGQVTLLCVELHSSSNEVEISKDKCLYKCLFNSTDGVVHTQLSLNTVTIQRNGILILKILVDHVTEADRELVRNEEQELNTIRLKEHDCAFSKVASII